MPQAGTVNSVRTGLSREAEPELVARELAQQIGSRDLEYVLYFASSRYVPAELAAAMAKTFGPRCAGCTTAGEIGPGGYTHDGVVAVAFGQGPIKVHAFALEDASSFDPAAFSDMRARFDADRAYPDRSLGDDCFAMLLIDGLCGLEEHVVAAVHHHFDPMSIVGGSAGDDLAYKATWVFEGGRALSGAAVILIVEMGGVPFRTFRLQDFAPISDYLVVTEADPVQRIVYELDGEPAQDVYSAWLNMSVADLGMAEFSSHSLMVQIGPECYVRSVRCITPDGGLKLHAAIDRGAIVRICRSEDSMVALSSMLSPANAPSPTADLMICFDCMHRRRELERYGQIEEASRLIARVRSIGFTTYGEVVDSLHVNQTLTGVLIGDGSLTRTR